jgi:hypothetical protein
MFRDDEQLARCCQALLAQGRMECLWKPDGQPTLRALQLANSEGGAQSRRDKVLLEAVFAFWKGSGGPRLCDILETLDGETTEALCFLVLAIKRGHDDVDAWLDEYEVRPQLGRVH